SSIFRSKSATDLEPQRRARRAVSREGVDVPYLPQPTLSHYLVLGAILFAINLNFIAFSRFLGDTSGQIFVFFILTVAAAESAIGLAILVLLFRNMGSIDVEKLD